MPETRVLLVTLMYRLYGRAMRSWERAIARAEKDMPGVRVDHLKLYGKPLNVADDGHTIVTHKYMEAREIFLPGDWWAMVSIEDDMVLPDDALVRLVRLLEGGADIGYGLYVWRHGTPKWSAYTKLDARTGISVSRHEEQAREWWGTVQDVAGVGMGCTILSRSAVESLPFRRGGPACNDWYLSVDAQRAGMVQRCDLGLVCGHMTTEPSPRVLWPDPDGAKHMTRVEFLP